MRRETSKEERQVVGQILGKEHFSRGNSQCKGPIAEACPVCLKNIQEASVPGVRGKSSRRDTREVMGGGRA